MKKLYVFVSVILFAITSSVKAQGLFSENLFNHFALGATLGTPGFGLDIATTVGNHFQLRTGFTTVPDTKMTTDLDVSSYANGGYSGSDNFDFEGKLHMTNLKILVDIFPSKKSNFHFTIGTYMGSSKLMKVNNKENGSLISITNYNNQVSEDNQIGIELGDYLLKPDDHGNVEANVKVNGVKPYLGIGFGRAVPRKNRIGFMMELGCQFWGTPKVYASDHRLTSEDLGGDDDGAINTLSKMQVYPVISVRLCGKIL